LGKAARRKGENVTTLRRTKLRHEVARRGVVASRDALLLRVVVAESERRAPRGLGDGFLTRCDARELDARGVFGAVARSSVDPAPTQA
jgi:hypothetical protein